MFSWITNRFEMLPRLSQAVISLLAAFTLVLSVWVLMHSKTFDTSMAGGPSESFLMLFSSKIMLQAFPGNWSAALKIYALATALAAALALALTLRPQRGRAALLLGVALGGISFFTAYFGLGRHVPFLRFYQLLEALDYVGMIAFAFGIHAMLQIALCYPQPIDEEAYFDYTVKQFSRKQFRILMPNFAKMLPSFFGAGGSSPAVLAERIGFAGIYRCGFRLARSAWFPLGLAVIGCGLVALLRTVGPQSAEWLKAFGFILLICAMALLSDLTANALGWQYRLGDSTERNILLSFQSGIVLTGISCGASCMGAFLVGFDLNQGPYLPVFTVLAPPLTAIAILLFLGGAIFFFGAIDSRMAIRKTSVYGLATLLLVAAVAAAENSAVTHVVQRFGLPLHSGSMLAGATVAILFAPMRKHIESGVERVIDQVLPASALAEAHRETVTVVFGDLSGYTALSARDEPKALTLASLLHKESRRIAERHGGRLVKSIGDAVLLSFPEPGEAVIACTELREKFATAAGVLNLPALPLHFGLHAGEVVRDKDGDIFGGTVNLAARLQGVAHASQIVVSDSVASAISSGNFVLESLGAKTLKNVPVPINCFLVV